MNNKKTDANTKGRFALRFGRQLAALVLTLVVSAVSLLLPIPVAATSSGGQVDVCGGTSKCNAFVNTYINPVVVLLTVVVGIAAVISIIMAGIQYASSADDPGTVSKAKQRIVNTIIGLLAYIFLLAFFNYLVPGGFF